jgi:4-amino-4-deoxy-L-arabinose transferase-like glycosyltransferase
MADAGLGPHSGAQADGRTANGRRVPLLLLVLAAATLFVNFWGWDLWAPDEPRYAQVARETLEDGRWLVPHLGGTVYSEKPPLYFWLLAGSYTLFGQTPFAVRLLPVLSACGTILVTYALGRKLFNARAGLLAGTVLATSVLVVRLARHGNIDSTLTLATTGAMALVATAYLDGRRALYWPAYALMGLGVLLKGPVGALIPLLSFVVFLLVVRDAPGLRRAHVLGGLGVVVVIVAAWLVPAAISGGSEYARSILFKQNVGRALVSFSHEQAPYYYLTSLPADFFPWVFFLPQAVVFAVRRRTPQRLFALVWLATVFVFFSAMSGKRGLYLLPLFPAAALLVGELFDAWLRGEIGRRALDAAALALGAVLVLGGIAAGLLGRVIAVPDYLRQPAVGLGWTMAVPLGLGGLGLIVAVAAGRRRAVFPVTALVVVAVSVIAALLVFPALNENKTARFICDDLLRDRRDDAPVILYRHESRSGAYDFYTRLPIEEIRGPEPEAARRLAERLAGLEKAYVIVDRKDYDRLAAELTASWRLVAARQVGHRTMRVFRFEANDNGSRP